MNYLELESLSLLIISWKITEDFSHRACDSFCESYLKSSYGRMAESLKNDKLRVLRLTHRRPKDSALDRMLRSNEDFSIYMSMEYQEKQMSLPNVR